MRFDAPSPTAAANAPGSSIMPAASASGWLRGAPRRSRTSPARAWRKDWSGAWCCETLLVSALVSAGVGETEDRAGGRDWPLARSAWLTGGRCRVIRAEADLEQHEGPILIVAQVEPL